MVDCGQDIYFDSDNPRRIKITVINNGIMKQQMWCRVRIYGPDEVRFKGGREFKMQLGYLNAEKAEAIFEIDASEYDGGELELLFDVSLLGRHTSSPVKVVLVRKPVSE